MEMNSDGHILTAVVPYFGCISQMADFSLHYDSRQELRITPPDIATRSKDCHQRQVENGDGKDQANK